MKGYQIKKDIYVACAISLKDGLKAFAVDANRRSIMLDTILVREDAVVFRFPADKQTVRGEYDLVVFSEWNTNVQHKEYDGKFVRLFGVLAATLGTDEDGIYTCDSTDAMSEYLNREKESAAPDAAPEPDLLKELEGRIVELSHPATGKKLGLVRVGEGLTISKEGTLSVNMAWVRKQLGITLNELPSADVELKL